MGILYRNQKTAVHHRVVNGVLRLGLVVLVVSACSPAELTATLPPAIQTQAITPTPLASLTATLPPTVTPTPTASPTPTPTPLPTPMVLVVSVVAEDTINLHADPDEQSDVVGELGPGIFVPLLDMTEDGLWLKIGMEAVGWVSARLVSLSGDVLTGDLSAPKRQALLQADTPVNVRSGPSIRNRVLGQLKSGQVVLVQGMDEAGAWLQIEFKGREGWVNTQTVIVAGGDPSPTPTPTLTLTPEVTEEP